MEHSIRYQKIKNGKWRATIYLGKRPTKNGTMSNVTKQITATSEKGLKDKVKDYIDYNGFQGKVNFSEKKTIEELAREWFNREKKPIEKGLKLKTLQRIDEVINNQIIPYFGNYEIDNLNTDTVNDILKYLSKACGMRKGYSHSTLKKIKTYLNQMYDYAISKKYCKENPITYVTVPLDEKSDLEADIHNKTLTSEELERYIKIATAEFSNGVPMYRYGYGLVFIAFTGLRAAEAIALKWSDIDLERGIVKIRKNQSDSVKNLRSPDHPNERGIVIDSPKTKSSIRDVVLNPKAIEAINNLKMITNPDNISDGYVFLSDNGTSVSYGNLRRSHEYIMAKAGIKNKCASLHILRHTYATLLYEHNVPVNAIADELGHSSVDITRRCYIHPIKEKSNPNVKQIQTLTF